MNFKLVGIGEVLWDLLPGGRQLGGAPANFAYHARALGADSCIISRVGSDSNGRDLLHRLQQLGVPTDCIEIDPAAPTGTVSVEVTPDGQPCFTIHEHVAWDRIAGEEPARHAVAEANAICFGTLAQRCEVSRTAIRRLVRSTPPEAWRVLDVNLRQHFYSREIIEQSLALANVLKVNDAELPLIGEMFGLAGDPRSQLADLAARFQLRLAACTRGAHGSLLLAGSRWSDHPGVPAKVVDTVGAGDSFTAAMTLGLLAGWDLDEVNLRANQIAACVASSAGGTPPLPPELRSPFSRFQPSTTS
jgi:fructokinase